MNIYNAKDYFPNLEVKYKTESTFMKILGTLLFFNKGFMDRYTTTIGSTIYFPSEEYVVSKPTSAKVIFLHELTHIYDSKRLNNLLYSFLYLFPQILAPLALLLLPVCWWLSLILFAVFLSPLPAYFRTYFEKRAYMVSLYAAHKLSKGSYNLDRGKEHYILQFKTGSYYFMWWFDWKLRKDFDEAVKKIKAGKRPYDEKVFDYIDDLISQM